MYAGVDYGAILQRAQAEADVIVWDGGNNDCPFTRPDLLIVVVEDGPTITHGGMAGAGTVAAQAAAPSMKQTISP